MRELVKKKMSTAGKVMILDDNEFRHEYFNDVYLGFDVYHAYTYNEAISLLNKFKFDVVSLDHDLGDFHEPDVLDDYELTGLDVCDYIRHHLNPDHVPDEIIVHSANPAGAQRMMMCLRDFNVKRRMVSV